MTPPPHVLTRAQVEALCDDIRDMAHMSFRAALVRDHDAAQRRTIEQQAQEIERLDKDLGAERVRGNFYKAEIDRSDALLNQFGIPNIAHECGDMLKPVDERIELVFVRLDTINQQLAARTAERDGWKGQYEACHVLHLEAQAECEKQNIFMQKVRIVDLEQRLTAAEQEAGRLREAMQQIVDENAEAIIAELKASGQRYHRPAIHVDVMEQCLRAMKGEG